MPKMREIILKLEGFKYATSLESNMGYYHMHLRKEASNLCNIILPWWDYQYKHLPMGISNPPEIFQGNMNKIFNGFEFIWAYINDLLIIAKGGWFITWKIGANTTKS